MITIDEVKKSYVEPPPNRRTTFLELLIENEQATNSVTKSVLKEIIKKRVEQYDFT